MVYKDYINFLIEVGKLKTMKRRGWVLRGVKNPETIAEHIYRMSLMAWLFGKKKKFNTEKIIKMALVHDLCEIYAGDTTPYDSLIHGKNEKEIKEIIANWPGFSRNEKEKINKEKVEKELKSLEKITKKLPQIDKDEIISLWKDYEEGITKEGRFLRQLDRIESLFQAMEYWKKDPSFPIKPFWAQMKELIDDKDLLEFVKDIDSYFII